jgi:hypothetical protein
MCDLSSSSNPGVLRILQYFCKRFEVSPFKLVSDKDF